MHPQVRFTKALFITMLALLLATVIPGAALKAAPLMIPVAQAAPNPVELHPTDDARTQTGSPDTNFGNGYLWVGHPEVHYTLIKFDLTVLPADAQITRAELQLYFTGIYTGTNEVEVGRIDGTWDEATLIGSTPVNYTWSGQFQTVTSTGKDDPSVVSWNVTQLAQAWQSGARVNDGLALRGNGGELKAAHSKETGAERNDDPYRGPKLLITYALPPDEDPRRPDLGDAPDSTNHHGQNNTAYPGTGTLGQFPTVWESPANQPAGPRHDNETGEGILGEFISREREADVGPDQDGPNNIIRNAAGATGDVADMDRGDDGWRNRGIAFFNCTRQTLTVRVSKAQNATLEKMYLNVWFDGNRDGDWGDQNSCPGFPGLPSATAYEWIVQDQMIDMTAIPAGGYVDLPIVTEHILNSTTGLPHWMRFTLSETRAVQPPSGIRPDGRGPHPNSAQKSFRFGETEDVLQKPPAPGEPGELLLEKRVITQEDPVDYPGEVTYQIRLRHQGGTAPVDAQIRDQIGFPQHLLPRFTSSGDIVYIKVTSPSGGAAPLEAGLSYVDGARPGVFEHLIAWDGTLEPDSEVLLTFDVHVHPYCPAMLQTKTITNLARARAVDGELITAEASYVAKCPGYDADGGIQFEPQENPIDLDDLIDVPWQSTVWNKHPVSVTLGFFQQPDGNRTRLDSVLATETNGPNKNGRVDAGATDVRFLRRVILAPDEKQLVDLTLRMEAEISDELSLDKDYSPIGKLMFCILPPESDRCANVDEYPNMVGEAPPPVWVPRPEELGDAPDSTNHFAGVAMTAYPGVQANFPTVFDPGTGADQGPKHRKPQLLHLGPGVSREAEADLGPDADGINNIWPPADANDQDWFDDGARLTNLANCQPARVDARVNISQQAVNWFGNNNRVAYLNVWLDSNHDGDWADGFICVDEAGQNKDVVEHILIDYPVDVAALGAGLQTLNNIVTGLVGWPAQGADAARWVRFTLSEEPSNKPLNYNGIVYGDGRGYATPFRTGETEDYLWVLEGAQANGPDVALQVQGRIVPVAQDGHEVRLKFDYANVGVVAISGATLTLSKNVLNVESIIRSVQGPGLHEGDVNVDGDKIVVSLPALAPNASSSVAMRLGLPASPVRSAAASDAYTLTAQIDLAGDINLRNNRASTALILPREPLRLAAGVEGDNLPRKADTTCRDEVWFQGRGEPFADVDIYVNDASNIRVQPDADGRITDLRLTNLPAGRSQIWLNYAGTTARPGQVAMRQAVRLVVDDSLPVDPISLLLIDSQGRQFHPNTLGWANGGSQLDQWPLQEGETYTIQIDVCVGDPNLRMRYELGNVFITSLYDDDGDGTYVGSFVYNRGLQSAGAASTDAGDRVELVVESGGVERRFAAEAVPLAQGTIRNGVDGQPVANATVSALVADGAGFSAIGSTESSAPAVQQTGGDGGYGFQVADGSYRLQVEANGYQPYRSGDVAVDNGVLATEIALSPAIAAVANHIVYVTANGFEPAVVNAAAGDVIFWVNSDLDEHSVQVAGWKSGLLAVGEGYKVQVMDPGTITVTDGENPLATGSIVVDDPESTGGTG